MPILYIQPAAGRVMYNHAIRTIRPRKIAVDTASIEGTSRPTAAANTGTKYIMPNVVLLPNTADSSFSVEVGQPRMRCNRLSMAKPNGKAESGIADDRRNCPSLSGNTWAPTKSVATSQRKIPTSPTQNCHGALILESAVVTVTPQIGNPFYPSYDKWCRQQIAALFDWRSGSWQNSSRAIRGEASLSLWQDH